MLPTKTYKGKSNINSANSPLEAIFFAESILILIASDFVGNVVNFV